MTGRLLSPEEMLKIIWDMGVEAEKKGVMIDQKMRFDAIAQAQDAKTLEWLDKTFADDITKVQMMATNAWQTPRQQGR